MKNETLEIIAAVFIIAGTASLLALINHKRKHAILRRLNKYSNIPRFIEHQMNSTHKRLSKL